MGAYYLQRMAGRARPQISLQAGILMTRMLSSLFFDMEWMFGIMGGFNVVIGNPPYISFRAIEKGQ